MLRTRRAADREKLLLPADRVIKGQTREYRRVLISRFRAWLWKEQTVSFHGLLNQKSINAEAIDYWLAEYGRELYVSGKAYGQHSETINAVSMMNYQTTIGHSLGCCICGICLVG